MTFDDNALRAYLDDQMSAETRERFEAALEQDETLAARLADLDPMRGMVQGALSDLPNEARLAGMLPSASPNQTNVVPWAAAIGVLAIGIGAFAVFSQPSASQWHEEVAAYQALYVPQTIARLDTDPQALKDQFQRASDVLGRQLDPSKLNIDGLTLRRAQILGFNGAPLIQIVYSDAKGRPIALCILNEAKDDRVESLTLSGLASATWAEDGLGFILIGGQDSAFINERAQNLSQTLAL